MVTFSHAIYLLIYNRYLLNSNKGPSTILSPGVRAVKETKFLILEFVFLVGKDRENR